MEQKISILYPATVSEKDYRLMSDIAWHDLGMDQICQQLTKKEKERVIIQAVLKNISDNTEVSRYRLEVFDDIYRNPLLQENILSILEQVNQLQDYMSLKRNLDQSEGVWSLMRRFKEVKDYVYCIEQMDACLSQVELHSNALLNLKEYIHKIQEESGFAQLKKDIESLKLDTKKVQSVTIGVNLNENYEASSMGIVSLNEKQFTQANVLNQFTQRFSKQNQIQKEAEWKNQYTYQTISEKEDKQISLFEKGVRVFTAGINPIMGLGIGLSKVTSQEVETNLLDYLNQVATKMLASNVKTLKDTLAKYATISIYSISGLIPEFTYYVLWAKFIRSLEQKGYWFCKAELSDSLMNCKCGYNLKLASLAKTEPSKVVGNDLDFSKEHNLYVLTGANRGGKTTFTQAIGQMFVLAQGGLYVPARHFSFKPLDGIYTHFPADEDKTLDYGRLGEECQRFKDLYNQSTPQSLLLLNESFSTTSFEEGYYIAKDAIKAILLKGSRTIFNTHMHKLAQDLEELNRDFSSKAISLIVESENHERSYRIKIAPTTGKSQASDIARKYGVTFEQLIK
ncbi:MAG: DNA mismatch repair protein [Firmicutes bacterium]|nr:DNA mismatch repair protein [Bacillota bacterium]